MNPKDMKKLEKPAFKRFTWEVSYTQDITENEFAALCREIERDDKTFQEVITNYLRTELHLSLTLIPKATINEMVYALSTYYYETYLKQEK